jgi:hypothetical protein
MTKKANSSKNELLICKSGVNRSDLMSALCLQHQSMNRKSFIVKLAGVSSLLSLNQKTMSQIVEQRPDPLSREMVQEFVANSHGNLQKVRELYEREPRLVFASHDWGGGDFESGIEAAGHTGQMEIVHFLLSKGARINFFTLCMLGKIDLVKNELAEFPNLLNAKGPHGLTPLHHANQGGADAMEVKKFLASMGATELQIKI